MQAGSRPRPQPYRPAYTPTPRPRPCALACGLLAAAAGPALQIGVAYAQARGATNPSDSGTETLVVTAERRPENLNDVAMAVAAFDGETLLAAGITDAMQLQTIVPSLTYMATGYSAQPYLRGIGTRQSFVGLEPSIATYIDDRYVARPFAAMFDMLDIARVEVLKGPQGVLYGRNAAGGAIRAITKDPTDPSLELAASAGNFDARRLSVAAGGPLSRSVRGQVTAALEQRDGFARNLVADGRATADDLDHQAVRGKLLWDLTDAVTAKLALSWWKYTDWAGRDVVAAGVPEANRGAALYGGLTSRERDQFATTLTADNDLQEVSADLRFDIRLARLDVVSITTFTDDDFNQVFDVDASSAKLVDLVNAEPSDTWSQEVQLLSQEDAALPWLAGIYLYRQDATNTYIFEDTVSAQPASPVGTDLSNGLQTVLTEAYALFAQAAYPFNDRWTASFGGRWSVERKAATLADAPGTVTNVPTPWSDEHDWDNFTPRISLEYRGDFGLAYVSYSRGFKSGGYNYPASVNPVLNPETLDSYEVGVTSDLAGQRLHLRSALFFYDFRDLQVTRGGTATFLTTENAASARVRGLELDLSVSLTPTLSLNAGIALIDSEYTDYTAGVLVPQLAPPYGSTPLPGGLDVRGRPLLRSPDEAAYLGIRYEARLAHGGHLPVSLAYSYKSDYYFDFSAVAETEWLEQGSYGVLNARVGYASAENDWEIGIWGRNLTDSSYYEDAVLIAASSRVSYADPRTYGVDFKFRR
jgi:iron complex outermembrane recepter protein